MQNDVLHIKYYIYWFLYLFAFLILFTVLNVWRNYLIRHCECTCIHRPWICKTIFIMQWIFVSISYIPVLFYTLYWHVFGETSVLERTLVLLSMTLSKNQCMLTYYNNNYSICFFLMYNVMQKCFKSFIQIH